MQLVLRAMLVDPTEEAYGAQIGRAAGLPSGTITPIVARLENVGILVSRIEEVDPGEVGRPRRKYYSFTPHGAERARTLLERPARPAPAGVPRPGLAGGLA